MLAVQNMTCEFCAITVRKALEKAPGVMLARVDFARKTAIVTFDTETIKAPALVKATTEAGFPSTVYK